MSKTLYSQIQGNIYATLTKTLPTDTIVDNCVQPLNITMVNGATFVDAANQLFSGEFTLAAGTSTTYNLNNFGGVVDGVGDPLNMVTIKALFIQNVSGTFSNVLTLSGQGAGPNGWVSCFTGTHNLYGDDGYFLVTAPGLFGFNCQPGVGGYLLQVSNTSLNPITYNFVVIGANGTN